MSDLEKQVEKINQNEYTSPKAKQLLKDLYSEYLKVNLELENFDSDWVSINELYDKSWEEQYSTRESFVLANEILDEIDSKKRQIEYSMTLIPTKLRGIEKTQAQFDEEIKEYEELKKEKFCFLFWCW